MKSKKAGNEKLTSAQLWQKVLEADKLSCERHGITVPLTMGVPTKDRNAEIVFLKKRKQ